MGGIIPLDALQKVSGGTPLDVVGGAAGAGGVMSSLGAAASMSNPIMAGMQIMSMLSGSSINKSGAQSSTGSGFAMFEGENTQEYKRPLLDFSNPISVVIMSAGVVALVWAYKKYKG